MPWNKSLKFLRVTITICTSGFCSRNSVTTGTVIATSPNAEKRYAKIVITFLTGMQLRKI